MTSQVFFVQKMPELLASVKASEHAGFFCLTIENRIPNTKAHLLFELDEIKKFQTELNEAVATFEHWNQAQTKSAERE